MTDEPRDATVPPPGGGETTGPAGGPNGSAARRGPLAHLAERCARTGSPATATLREVPFLAQVELRVNDEDEQVAARTAAEFLGCPLPGPGRASGDGRPHVLWCGPGWYLVVDAAATGRGLATGLCTALGGEYGAVCGSVVDVSAQRAVVELTGPRAREVLAHGCPMDLHPRVFGPGQYAQTVLAKATVGIQHIGRDPQRPAFRLLVRASFADYLARWLLDTVDTLDAEAALT